MSSSDEEDNECPLCTEELDLTDQAAELCQCGYKICLWCYNQIIENAAKDNTEGRCPACRTVYNPDKINMAEIDQDLLAESRKKKREKKRERQDAHASYASPLGRGGSGSLGGMAGKHGNNIAQATRRS